MRLEYSIKCFVQRVACGWWVRLRRTRAPRRTWPPPTLLCHLRALRRLHTTRARRRSPHRRASCTARRSRTRTRPSPPTESTPSESTKESIRDCRMDTIMMEALTNNNLELHLFTHTLWGQCSFSIILLPHRSMFCFNYFHASDLRLHHIVKISFAPITRFFTRFSHVMAKESYSGLCVREFLP